MDHLLSLQNFFLKQFHAGNLKLENVLEDDDSLLLNEFINKYYHSLFKKTVSPYFMVTGRYGITDHYAVQAMKLGVPMGDFNIFCSTVSELDRDNFNDKLMEISHNVIWYGNGGVSRRNGI